MNYTIECVRALGGARRRFATCIFAVVSVLFLSKSFAKVKIYRKSENIFCLSVVVIAMKMGINFVYLIPPTLSFQRKLESILFKRLVQISVFMWSNGLFNI
jgi:hypothetical protein